MWFGIITLFPEMFSALQAGITGRALAESLFSLQTFNPRDYATDKHRKVDDSPYGGGAGMVMLAEPLLKAIAAAKTQAPTPTKVIYLSPQGKKFSQAAATTLHAEQSLILLAGRYEGIDQRVIELAMDEEWSIGDYVLSGGELAAMVMIDTITRLIPGVVGDPASVNEDSLFAGMLKHPQYSRPEMVGDLRVPEVLLSGHHQHIMRWRKKQSLGVTWKKRPDLLQAQKLTVDDEKLLKEFMQENEIKLENL